MVCKRQEQAVLSSLLFKIYARPQNIFSHFTQYSHHVFTGLGTNLKKPNGIFLNGENHYRFVAISKEPIMV